MDLEDWQTKALAQVEARRKKWEERRQVITINIHDEDGKLRKYQILDSQIQSSEFLAASLNQHWQSDDSTTPVIHIGTVQPALFDLYFGWLLSGRITQEDFDTTELTSREYYTVDLLFNLFALGNLYMDYKFQNYILDCMDPQRSATFFRGPVDAEVNPLLDILEMCSYNNTLFRFVIEQGRCFDNLVDLIQHIAKSNHIAYKTVLDLGNLIVEWFGNDKIDVGGGIDRCYYHKHVPGDQRCFGESFHHPGQDLFEHDVGAPFETLQDNPVAAGASVFAADLYRAWKQSRRFDLQRIKKHLNHVSWQPGCLYLELFALADQHSDYAFQNMVMDKLKKFRESFHSSPFKDRTQLPALALYAFSSTTTNLSLFRFIIEELMTGNDLRQLVRLARHTDSVPQAALSHICEWLVTRKSMAQREWCHRYHVHLQGEQYCDGSTVYWPPGNVSSQNNEDQD